jgi:hypothetical protein
MFCSLQWDCRWRLSTDVVPARAHSRWVYFRPVSVRHRRACSTRRAIEHTDLSRRDVRCTRESNIDEHDDSLRCHCRTRSTSDNLEWRVRRKCSSDAYNRSRHTRFVRCTANLARLTVANSKLSTSINRTASSSKSGFNSRQCLHQGAKKTTKAKPCRVNGAKLSAVNSVTAVFVAI